jgi:spermidine synthase
MPNLNAIAQDGRWGIAHSDQVYDLVAIDAYRPPYIPWHLTTVEFFEEINAHLAENGVVVINVGRAPEDRSLIDALVTTLSQVYPSVHVMDIPYTFNSMVYATRQPTTWDNLALNYNALVQNRDTHPLLLDSLARAYNYQVATPEPTLAFTDEHAPVEWIINRMVLNFIFSGEYEELQ